LERERIEGDEAPEAERVARLEQMRIDLVERLEALQAEIPERVFATEVGLPTPDAAFANAAVVAESLARRIARIDEALERIAVQSKQPHPGA